MFPEESSGAKDCDSEIAVGLSTARTTLVESAFGDSRHKQVRFVVSGRSGSAIGRCKGPSRGTGSERSSLGETSGGSGSSQHDDYYGFSNSELSSLKWGFGFWMPKSTSGLSQSRLLPSRNRNTAMGVHSVLGDVVGVSSWGRATSEVRVS